jgi:hypothetical protein
MTTVTRMELDPSLRSLIENRLDAIDRVLLLAGVSRGERHGIVEEVETQIYELLARRTDAPTRRDVLTVLATLDPPEAYAPEGSRVRARTWYTEEQSHLPQPSLLALGSAVASVLDLLLLGGVAFLMAESEVPEAFALLVLFVLGLVVPAAVTVAGGVSIGQILRSRGRLFGLPAAVLAALLFPLLLANGLLVGLVMVGGDLGLILLVALAFLAANVWCVYRVWNWISSWRRRMATVDTAR